jgi:iron complex outermembrane receptor protein
MKTHKNIRPKLRVSRLPLTAAIYMALSTAALAAPDDQAAEEKKATLDTVTVTAQKRTENLQEVPISIQVLGTQKLTEMNVSDFEDYAKLLPSLSYTQGEGGGSDPYIRGVVSGGDGNHSGPSPSVGIYLDEQPVTGVGGSIEPHIYDIERVEALAGPQGTLYGASSQSGTIKIITNKPDSTGFAAGYAFEVNSVSGGGDGHVLEGFLNLPLSDVAALRVVGWDKREAGWIDNVYNERTFPTSGITMNNADLVEEDYNDSHTTGARAALKIDLGENWSIMPSIMTQKETTNGSFAFDPVVGDLKISRYYPESLEDKFTQVALTVTGKIGNFDLVYAFSTLDRDGKGESDYNDYGFWYDVVSGYGYYAIDNNYDYINPSQITLSEGHQTKRSHEIRISSPQDERFRFIGGYFQIDQYRDIQERYLIADWYDGYEVTGWEDTIWLTKQDRRDSEKAVFGEFSFDFTDKLTATAGFRYFENDNSLRGFFGFSRAFSSQGSRPGNQRYGEAGCAFVWGSTNPADWPKFNGAPCEFIRDPDGSLGKTTKENGTLGKFNVTYKLDDSKLIYGTWSEGYRPGGVNRRATLPPYQADYLTNWELGWKTSWMDNRLTFNGALFRQEWKDFQFTILGQNGLTEIKNANQARIDGLEMDVNFAATYNLQLSAGVAFYDAKLTENYCGFTDEDGNPVTDCADPEAPTGTRLPVTADFKGNLNARYTFDWNGYEPFIQGSVVYEGRRTSDLRILEREILGDMPSYTMFDLSAGIRKDSWTLNLYVKNLFDERAEFNRFTMCAVTVCGNAFPGDNVFPAPPEYANGQIYTVAAQPRTIGLRFSQEF